MRASMLSPLLVVAACSGHHGTDDGARADPVGVGGAADRARCATRSSEPLRAAEAVLDPWILRAANGPVVLGHMQRADRAAWLSGEVVREAPQGFTDGAFGVAWTGQRLIYVADHRLESVDARFERPTALRLALDATSRVRLIQRPGAVLAMWMRTTRDGDQPLVAMLGPTGDVTMAPRALEDPVRDEAEEPEFEGDARRRTRRRGRGELGAGRVQSVTARWDFGRFVVQARGFDRARYFAWVLDPDGQTLWSTHWQGEGQVACPSSGCVRLSPTLDPATGTTVLKVQRVDDGQDFNTSVAVRELRGASVSGDRVLVLHADPGGESTGCSVDVVDVSRHAVVGELSEPEMACDPASVASLPRGFALAVPEGDRGVLLRTVECPE